MQNNKKNIAIISNKLVNASYMLELSEKRLIWSLLSRIRQSYIKKTTKDGEIITSTVVEGEVLDSREWYSINVLDFAKDWDISGNNARKEVSIAANTLYNRSIEIKKEDGSWSKFRWIQQIEYDREEDSIKLRWTEPVIEHISQLTKAFTNLTLADCKDFKSIYTWKLYDYLKSTEWKRRGNFAIEMVAVQDMMDIMSVPKSCREYKVFKASIIKPAIAELVHRGVFKILELREEKRGRSIVKIGFVVRIIEKPAVKSTKELEQVQNICQIVENIPSDGKITLVFDDEFGDVV